MRLLNKKKILEAEEKPETIYKKDTHFVLYPFEDTEKATTRPVEFLKAIYLSKQRFSWEYHKQRNNIIQIRNWAENGLHSIKDDVILSSFPESKLKRKTGTILNIRKNDHLKGAVWNLSDPYYKTISIYDTNTDNRGKRILSTLNALDSEVLVQILVNKTNKNTWYKRNLRDLIQGYHIKKKKLEKKENDEVAQSVLQSMNSKVKSNHPLQTQIRILGADSSKRKLNHTFNRLERAIKSYQHEKKQGIEINLVELTDKQIKKLVEKMLKRKWFYTGWWHKFKAGWRKKRTILVPKEAANFVDFPQDLHKYNLITNKVKSHPVSPSLLQDFYNKKLEDATVIGEDTNEDIVPIFDFNKHIHISGRTGMGKSTLMENIILDKISDDKNVIVFDPHHSLTESVLQKMPDHKLNDVIYIGPKSPLGINALSPPGFPDRLQYSELDEEEKRNVESAKQNTIEKTTTSLLNIFKESFGEQFFGPQNEEIFEFFTSALLKEKGANFVDFYHLLTNKEAAQRFAEISTKEIETFVTNTYQSLRPDQTQSTINKVGKIYRSRTLIEQLCRRDPEVQIADLFEPGKIVIVDIRRSLQDEDRGSFLASVLLNHLWTSIVQRNLLKEERREETYLFIDEIQIFNEAVFNSIVSQGRKYNLNLTIAHQHLNQLSEELRETIRGNVGTFITLNTSDRDAKFLNNHEEKIEDREFKHIDKYNAIVQYTGNSKYDPVLASLKPPEKKRNEHVETQVIDKMHDIFPNPKHEFQKAFTPRWTTERAEDWEVLTNILKLEVKNNIGTTLNQLEKELPRSDLKNIVRRLFNERYIRHGEDNDIVLTNKGKERIYDLMGKGSDAGQMEHRRTIARIFEILTSTGCEAEIVRQDEEGQLPDLVLLDTKNTSLNWEPSNVEIERSTISKPAKILSNLEKAMKQGKKVRFFVNDEESAKTIYNILENPYPSHLDNEYYKLKGEDYVPEDKMIHTYWEEETETELGDLCSIHIFHETDGKIFNYNPEDENELLGTYKSAQEKGYISDYKPEEISIGDEENLIDHDLRRKFYGKKKNGEEVTMELDEDTREILEDEWKHVTEKKQPQPNLNELGEEKQLVFTAEAIHAFDDRAELNKLMITTELRDKLREKDYKIEGRIGRTVSSLASKLNIDKDRVLTANQNGYDLYSHLERIDTLYRLYIVEKVGQGEHSFPEIFHILKGTTSYQTIKDLFDSRTVEIQNKELELFQIQASDEEKLFKILGRAQQDTINLDYVKERTTLSEDRIKGLLSPELEKGEEEERDEKTILNIEGIKDLLQKAMF